LPTTYLQNEVSRASFKVYANVAAAAHAQFNCLAGDVNAFVEYGGIQVVRFQI
jgi:hypothetical protein